MTITPEVALRHYQRGRNGKRFGYRAGDTNPAPERTPQGIEALCFVGALCWADSTGYRPEKHSPEEFVAERYGLTPHEVGFMEAGFDRFYQDATNKHPVGLEEAVRRARLSLTQNTPAHIEPEEIPGLLGAYRIGWSISEAVFKWNTEQKKMERARENQARLERDAASRVLAEAERIVASERETEDVTVEEEVVPV